MYHYAHRTLALFIAFALLVFGAALAGCGAPDKAAETGSGMGANDGSAPSGEAPGPIVVRDGLGREIRLERPAARLVSLYGIATHFLLGLGVQDRLVAGHLPPKNDVFLNALYPKGLPRVGGGKDVNIEELVTHRPDLVFVAGSNKETLSKLEEANIPTFAVLAEDLPEIKTTVEQIGRAVGAEQAAERLVAYLEGVERKVAERLKSIPETGRPSAYYVRGESVLTTVGRDFLQSKLIEYAGGKSATGHLSGGRIEVSAEDFLKLDPEILLIAPYSDVRPEDVYQDERWQNVRAVKARQVYRFPSNITSWDY
ncbi:MAG: ABC transporter substrate-binding protein, partial [Hydrogenibacillus sp.]|nr:ABC transporter substrate-binding protein [Hydrogenibacillus sp.]